jgi:hypothetical protein
MAKLMRGESSTSEVTNTILTVFTQRKLTAMDGPFIGLPQQRPVSAAVKVV